MSAIDTAPSIVLVFAIGVLFATGVYLLLERSLTRVLLGFILIGNGANLLFLVAGGRAGGAPIVGVTPENEMSDPLVQAMVLTAIVITLGLSAFVLAMAYRSWQLHGHDEVQDDLEDRRVARHAARNAPAFEDLDATETDASLDDEAAEVRDETDGDGDGITDGAAASGTGRDRAGRDAARREGAGTGAATRRGGARREGRARDDHRDSGKGDT